MITTETVTTCDRCQTPGAMEFRFALEGKHLAIDLCSAHLAELRSALTPWVVASRRAPIPQPRQRHARSERTQIAEQVAS